jgi:hypothetical protein
MLAIRLQCRNPSFHQIRTTFRQPDASKHPSCWRTFIRLGFNCDMSCLTARLTFPRICIRFGSALRTIQTMVSTGTDVPDLTIYPDVMGIHSTCIIYQSYLALSLTGIFVDSRRELLNQICNWLRLLFCFPCCALSGDHGRSGLCVIMM